ncbi:hypothetical protein LTR10_015214 [Elasticomyces elasticus]|uniref:TATA element modulatory factor 1 TATA binding domain-containing protein n=1 Tax=Exophiala sideris TaxID=1016849 RepID=A0ABR0JEE3_9EURO|nr:hypothetical protein LTR10_015214 [Elasticomyces elasticus]KAK5032689.1 hypothetical protein LTS07_004099 [Exophiala sideris]KAK5037131.1 hypothetical protein LTR13_004936 [Exophiala sideris]KAK5062213.1 hypothetical protein LTR69_004571 [Exophiala sideris]KAK5182289.1 hypothetical protein LTR44_005300 [Eurotiomycetes sp. CCFEE 6388]
MAAEWAEALAFILAILLFPFLSAAALREIFIEENNNEHRTPLEATPPENNAGQDVALNATPPQDAVVPEYTPAPNGTLKNTPPKNHAHADDAPAGHTVAIAPLLPPVRTVSGSLIAETTAMQLTDVKCVSSSNDLIVSPCYLPAIPIVSASFASEVNEMQFHDTSVLPIKNIGQPHSQYLVDELLEGEHHTAAPARIETVSAEDNKALVVATSDVVEQDVKQTNNASMVIGFSGPLPFVPSKAPTSGVTTPIFAVPAIFISCLYRTNGLTYTMVLEVCAPFMALITYKDARASKPRKCWFYSTMPASRPSTYANKTLVPFRKRGINKVDEPEQNCDRKRRLLKACRHRKILTTAGLWIPITWEPPFWWTMFSCHMKFAPRWPQFFVDHLVSQELPLQDILVVLSYEEELDVPVAYLPYLPEQSLENQYTAPSGATYVPIVHPPAEVFQQHGYEHVETKNTVDHVETSQNNNAGVIGAGRPRMNTGSTESENHSPVEITSSPLDTSFNTNATSPVESPRAFAPIPAIDSDDHRHCGIQTHIAEKYEHILKEKDALIEQLETANQQLINESAAEKKETEEAKSQLDSSDRLCGKLRIELEKACQTIENLNQSIKDLMQHNEELAVAHVGHQSEIQALHTQYEGHINELHQTTDNLREENTNAWDREEGVEARYRELEDEIESLQSQRDEYMADATTLEEEMKSRQRGFEEEIKNLQSKLNEYVAYATTLEEEMERRQRESQEEIEDLQSKLNEWASYATAVEEHIQRLNEQLNYA